MNSKKINFSILICFSIFLSCNVQKQNTISQKTEKFGIENIIHQKKLNPYYSKEEYETIANIDKNTFQVLSKPNENSALSTFLKQRLTLKDLKKVNFSKPKPSMMEHYYLSANDNLENYDNTIRLTFEISKKNKPRNFRVNTGDGELDNKIKTIFKNFPLTNLKLTDEHKTGKISVQLFANKKRKAIIKASTNAIHHELPLIKDCEELKYYSNLSSCFYKEIYKYLLNNISKETIIKQKERGELMIYLRFSIDSKGKIFNVNSIASNKIIKNEIDRVIESFDKKIIPAKRNGVPKDYFYETSYIIVVE